MSTKFKREGRYLVFKLSDVEEHFTPSERQQLARLAKVQRVGRSESGKPLLECVVVEADWPEYEPTWRAIEARVTGVQPSPNAVAYLDLGVGGYMDIGTDLTDEELAALPKGRHMLGVIGTYGVDGYVPAQLAPSDEYVGWYCAHCERGVDASEVTYHEQHQVCGRVITDDRPPRASGSVPEGASFVDTSQLESAVSTEIVHSYPPPSGWLRAIDEALVVAHLGVANTSDTYEQAKAKLDSLIGFHVDAATDPAVNGGWQLVPVNPTETFYQCFSAYDGTSYSNPFDRDEFLKDWRAALEQATEAKP